MSGDAPDDLLTPWHWLVIPEGTSKSRFVDENRAAYFVFTRDGATWESALSTLIEQGATDDEIWSGGWRDLLSIPVRRYLEALLGRLRLAAPLGRQTPTLRLDRYARAVVELREPDGTWPIQDTVAEALGLTSRTLRDKSIGGWAAILRRAAELAQEAEEAEEAEVPE